MAKHGVIVLVIAFSILASALGAYHLSAATIISGTDPSGDVLVMSYGTPPPSDIVSTADLISVKITFTESSLTAEFEVVGNLPATLTESNYSVYFMASIMGSYNGRSAQLMMGVGNVIGYTFYGQSFAVVQDGEGNTLAVYVGDATPFTVQGNKVVLNVPIGTTSFTPSLGNSTDSSMVIVGLAGPGGVATAIDELNLYESGTISGGEATNTETTTTTPPQTTTTTTTTQPLEYEDDPLKQTPTTSDVSVYLAPPTSSKLIVDPTTGFVEVDIQGTGSTSGAAPDHVGVGILAYLKDGNYTYAMYNGEGEWDMDNDPSNGYIFQMNIMGATINLEVKPTGPSENPWATFSYHFYGKVPGSAIAVFSSIQNIDRAYIYARAYLDRDETLWNQGYTDLSINAGIGEVTTTTTQEIPTTTTTEGTGEVTTTTTAEETETTGETSATGGFNPLIIIGAIIAVAVIVAVLFMLKRK